MIRMDRLRKSTVTVASSWGYPRADRTCSEELSRRGIATGKDSTTAGAERGTKILVGVKTDTEWLAGAGVSTDGVEGAERGTGRSADARFGCESSSSSEREWKAAGQSPGRETKLRFTRSQSWCAGDSEIVRGSADLGVSSGTRFGCESSSSSSARSWKAAGQLPGRETKLRFARSQSWCAGVSEIFRGSADLEASSANDRGRDARRWTTTSSRYKSTIGRDRFGGGVSVSSSSLDIHDGRAWSLQQLECRDDVTNGAPLRRDGQN